MASSDVVRNGFHAPDDGEYDGHEAQHDPHAEGAADDTFSLASTRANPGDAAYKAESLRRSNEEMRRRIQEMRNDIKQERLRVRDAHVDKVAAVKRMRDNTEVCVGQTFLCSS